MTVVIAFPSSVVCSFLFVRYNAIMSSLLRWFTNHDHYKFNIGSIILADLLENHRTLLINEDVSFLQSAFESQQQLFDVLPLDNRGLILKA